MPESPTNPAPEPVPDTRGGWFGFVSSKVVNVEPGEWGALLLAWVYFFSLLSSYYMLRPIRETMGIARSWGDLPWLFTATLLAMIPANLLFAWIASRVPRKTFIPAAHRFFGLNLAAFIAMFFLVPEDSRLWLGYCFYVWLSVFNLFVISIFWAFMADVFRPSQSKRLFGFIGVGGTIGAILGSGAVWTLAEHVSVPTMMIGSLVLLEVATQAMKGLSRSQRASLEEQRAGGAAREPSPRIMEGLRLIVRSRYLATIAVYLLITTITATFLYMEQGRIIDLAIEDEAKRTKVFALIDMLANATTLILQGFLTARLVRWLGIGWTLALLPMVVLLGFVGLAVAPVVWMIVAVQVARRGLHYAVARPVREMLFAPLGADAKYKSKPFIDTFIYRGGDQLAAWVPKWLALIAIPLAYVAIPAAVVWGIVGVVLGHMEKREESSPQSERKEQAAPVA